MTQIAANLPSTYRKIVVTNLSTDFEDATEIQTADLSPLISSLSPDNVVVQYHYWGINASDINFTAGRYDRTLNPPFDAGFEAVGEVVAVGKNVTKVKLGSPVSVMAYGAFAEFQNVHQRFIFPVPEIAPQYLNLINGLTGWLAINMAAKVKPGETVLVTAASGGTGQIAVQAAKLAGATVIGTCSSPDKIKYLQSIGCDRAINYKTESIDQVLRTEFPKGIDVVFDGVGGSMLDVITKHLRVRSRLLIIGVISSYQSNNSSRSQPVWNDAIPTAVLLSKSISVIGFFLPHWIEDGGKDCWLEIVQGVQRGKINMAVDRGETGREFSDLEDIKEGIQYLYNGKNIGKVVIANSKIAEGRPKQSVL